MRGDVSGQPFFVWRRRDFSGRAGSWLKTALGEFIRLLARGNQTPAGGSWRCGFWALASAEFSRREKRWRHTAVNGLNLFI